VTYNGDLMSLVSSGAQGEISKVKGPFHIALAIVICVNPRNLREIIIWAFIGIGKTANMIYSYTIINDTYKMMLNDREILLYYKPEIKKDKNTYVLATQLTNHVNTVNVLKEDLSETQLREILILLKVPVEKLIEKDSEIYKSKYKDKDLDEDGWVLAMTKNPDLIKTPIAFMGKRGVLVETPSNVLSLDPKDGYNNLDQ
jgi:arsenate reductase (glutaredoxin)